MAGAGMPRSLVLLWLVAAVVGGEEGAETGCADDDEAMAAVTEAQFGQGPGSERELMLGGAKYKALDLIFS